MPKGAKGKRDYMTPRPERPRIPDYGIPKSKAGLLPWKWAQEKLANSRQYWLMTVRTNGRPHAMVIWGLWFSGAFWFGTGSKTQKARNLATNPNCIVCTQDAAEAVILEGSAEEVTDADTKRKTGANIAQEVRDERRQQFRARLSGTSATRFRSSGKEFPENCDPLDFRFPKQRVGIGSPAIPPGPLGVT